MKRTFLVELEIEPDEDLENVAGTVQDLVSPEFDVISVKPWQGQMPINN